MKKNNMFQHNDDQSRSTWGITRSILFAGIVGGIWLISMFYGSCLFLMLLGEGIGDARIEVVLATLTLLSISAVFGYIMWKAYGTTIFCTLIAILVVAIASTCLLMSPLDKLGISLIEGGNFSTSHCIITAVLAIMVVIGVCLLWKKSVTVRAVVLCLISPFVLIGVCSLPLFCIGMLFYDVRIVCGVALLLLVFVKHIAVKIIAAIVFAFTVWIMPLVTIEQQDVEYTYRTVWETERWGTPNWKWSICIGWSDDWFRTRDWQNYQYEHEWRRDHRFLACERIGCLFDERRVPPRRKPRPPFSDEEKYLCELLHPYYASFSDISQTDIVQEGIVREEMLHLWDEVQAAYRASLPHAEHIILHLPQSSGTQIISGKEKDNHLREQLSDYCHPFLWEERIIIHHRNGSIMPGTDEADRLYDKLFDSFLGLMYPKSVKEVTVGMYWVFLCTPMKFGF